MKKLLKFKSATKLALFSTAMIITATLLLYALLSNSFFSILPQGGVFWEVLQLLLITALFIAPVAYVVSSLIIDRTLNPVRVMIDKVKSVGSRNFNSKIFIESTEDELTEYALAFNQMSSKLGEYVDSQRRFISDASHELVTPIAVIVGHADMLSRWGKDNPQILDDGLNIIKSEALAMNELVENLLFFARSDNSRLVYDKQDVNLSALLHSCMEEQRRLNPEFSITVNCKPLYIHADADALKRVMRILFANSVKYSVDTKQITVILEQDAAGLRLLVADRGIGIAPQYLPRLFDRFYRVDDSRNKDTGGTGLGLAIAKEILDAHGYAISAQSIPGEGTTMIINIPSSNLHPFTLTSS